MPEITEGFDKTLRQAPEGTTWGVIAVDAQTGEPVYMRAEDRPFRAASVAKLAINYALLLAHARHSEQVSSLKVSITSDAKEDGTGILQHFPDGFRLSLADAQRLMLAESDNTAANLIVRYLGGFGVVNELIRGGLLDLKDTRLQYDDTYGFNYGETNPREASTLFLESLRHNSSREALMQAHCWYGLRREIDTERPHQLKRLLNAIKYLKGKGSAALYQKALQSRREPTQFPSKEGAASSHRHDIAQINGLVIAAFSTGYPEVPYGPRHPAHAIHGRLGRLAAQSQLGS